jgi:hypothetical protein
LPVPQVKTDYSPQLDLHSPHFAMRQENRHSSTAVKEISVSVLPLLNVYLVFATQYLLVHH